MINFCLMSDVELGAMTKDDNRTGVRSGPSRMYNWLTPYGMDRKKSHAIFLFSLG